MSLERHRASSRRPACRPWECRARPRWTCRRCARPRTGRRFQEVARAVHVGAVELARVARPQPVVRGDVVDAPDARDRAPRVSRIESGRPPRSRTAHPSSARAVAAAAARATRTVAAVREKLADEIGAHESSAAGDERIHGCAVLAPPARRASPPRLPRACRDARRDWRAAAKTRGRARASILPTRI